MNLELDLKELDPIFTKKFFHFDEKDVLEEKEPSIDFPLLNFGKQHFVANLLQWLNSNDGEKFKEGVVNIIDNIEKLFQSWNEITFERKQIWKKNLAILKERFTSDKSNEEKPQEFYMLFTRGVINLNRILYKIQDDELSLTLRQTVMGN